MNDAPTVRYRRTTLKGLTLGSAALLLSQIARAQTADPAPPVPVKVAPLGKFAKDYSTAEFEFDGVPSLLVRLGGPPTDKTRALEVKIGGKPVYLSAFTRICTHLGCQPALPDARTHLQVCPCHGSTYSADGTVIKGPARRSLNLLMLEVRGTDIYAVSLAGTSAG